MGLFEGKTPAERNKTIAAIVLGVLSLTALYMAFGRGMFGGSTTTASSKATSTPSSKTSVKVDTTGSAGNQFRLPTADENALNSTVPVSYNPSSVSYGAPDAGRNIFAFYEPPPPTPYQTPSPTPPPPAVIPTPSPVPTPHFVITGVTPQSIYAGTKGGFRLDVYGERFPANAKIYFNQTEMPTTFVSPQALYTTIPENLVSQEGQKQIIVQIPDGQLYSPPAGFSAMAPPKPTTLQYIGMIGRMRYNNDTAYFLQTGSTTPFGARLNDVVGGRFRLVDISASAVTVEDTSLGFRHKISMVPATTGIAGSGAPPPGGGFVPYNPGNPQVRPNTPQMIPGQGIPQPVRPDQQQRRPPPSSKDDVDDNDPNL